jgi:hypothetical protein
MASTPLSHRWLSGVEASLIDSWYFIFALVPYRLNISAICAICRMVYQVESEVSILLLTIYSKCDRNDISESEVFNILSSIADDE